MAVLLCAVGIQLTAQQAVVTPLMTKDLADVPGKEALMLLVEYPPGSKDPVHRHNANAFVYILEGSFTDLTLGQTFTKGMYACRPPGMPHGPWRTDDGVLTFEVRYRT